MTASNIVILVLVIFLVCLAWRLLHRRGRDQSSELTAARTAIHACNCLLHLIGHIQQHRGMSSAYLGGDRSFARRMMDKRTEIEPLLAGLQQVALQEGGFPYPCFTPNEVSLLRHRWGTLTAELDTLAVEKSIATHSNLVSTLLNWLDALGEARIELPMGKQLPTGAVRNFSHRLPQLTECLGQARATGTGVAALGSCSAVARVRLMFLVSRAESLTEQACAVDSQGGAAAQKVKVLADLIRGRMLSSQKVDVSAEEYFAESTRAIDAVFMWVRACGQNLEQALPGNSGLGADDNSRLAVSR